VATEACRARQGGVQGSQGAVVSSLFGRKCWEGNRHSHGDVLRIGGRDRANHVAIGAHPRGGYLFSGRLGRQRGMERCALTSWLTSAASRFPLASWSSSFSAITAAVRACRWVRSRSYCSSRAAWSRRRSSYARRTGGRWPTWPSLRWHRTQHAPQHDP